MQRRVCVRLSANKRQKESNADWEEDSKSA